LGVDLLYLLADILYICQYRIFIPLIDKPFLLGFVGLADQQIDFQHACEHLQRSAIDDRFGEFGLDGIADLPGRATPAAASAVANFYDDILL